MSKPRYPNLRSALEGLGLTQAQFAEQLGITQGTVSRYIRGSRVPSLALALRIADAASVPVESLLSDSEAA